MSGDPSDPLLGTMLGPCRLEALVGRGGMGRVYRAHHVALDRTVAVKIVDRAEDSSGLEAVLAEARAAAKLDDPNVVAVYETGQDRGLSYIVMQWVEGESLEARVAWWGPLPPGDTLAIVRAILTGLRAAHAAGLVHCDVKPANILVDRRGAVKLADFGIAHSKGSAVPGGNAPGSYHFMAPEQGLGLAPDPRSDLYSVGATWYFALTGRMLFPGTALDALMRHREEVPPDVRSLRPDVTEKSAALISSLLAKDPACRPPSADAVLKEMDAVGMLLDTDASGSPFRILPPPMPAAESEPAAQARPGDPRPAAEGKAPAGAPVSQSFAPPPPPPPPDAPVLGSRGTFFALFGVIAIAAVGWPWRGAVFEDWAAGAVLLSAFPGLLTFGERRTVRRRAAGIALWLGGAACFARFVGLGTSAAHLPRLETMIACCLGAVCTGGAVYLGFWGSNSEEVYWARVLSPLGGLLVATGALSWSVGDGQGWIDGLRATAPHAWSVWRTTGGLWRWGGLAVVAGAVAAVRRLKTVSSSPTDRTLNWNK